MRGAQGPGCVLCRLPRSLLGAPTRPASHVAARQHFVRPGRLGGFITRRGRSMRTGGGVGLPGRRPLPPIPTAKQPLAPPQALKRARRVARTGAPSPPRDLRSGKTRELRPGSTARTEPSCSAVGLAPRPSEELAATSVRAGHQCRPHPRFLTEKREKPPRTGEACPQGLTQMWGRRARGGAGKRREVAGLGRLCVDAGAPRTGEEAEGLAVQSTGCGLATGVR